MGEGANLGVLCKMSPRTRNIAIALCLATTVLSGVSFVYATDGFYGTAAPSFWKAMHPTTLRQSDDVFLCNSMNGTGSDETFFPILFVSLIPLILFRLIRLQTRPSWIEVCIFGNLSLPFFIGMFTGLVTCADILLTLYIGKNLALGLCLLAWASAAALYLGIGKHR
ncbi:MAG: hypothetical protein V4586_13385 [Pseudomonadota bacterium]